MTLTRYREKRDFKATPEPRGRTRARKAAALSFVIQKHAASHLHYDFRLELDGVLLSWAVPKGPSLDPSDKRLAMHVEDHPVEYGGFEGIIPKGQYGGGTVLIWDRGTWSPVGDPHEGFSRGHLKFDLDGRKLHGRWALVKTGNSRYGGKGEPWLLIKDTDDCVRRGVDARITDSEPDSVVSGRDIEQIAAAGDRQWHSNRSVKANVMAGAIAGTSGKPAATAKSQGLPAGAKRAAIPARMTAMLATLVKAPPQGDDWVHEIKYDGYRMLVRIENGAVTMYSRNGKDWTHQFAAVAKDIGTVKAKTAWIDGEVCAIDAGGRSDFQTLQNALGGQEAAKLVFFAFDLLYLDGVDLREARLEERKRLLKELLERSRAANATLRYSPEVRGSGAEVFRQSCPSGLEGIVSKRVDSVYSSGARTRSWVKVKCLRRQEMVIGGYTEPQGGRQGFGALLLGFYEGGVLRYSGKVGTGFNDKTLLALFRKLQKLESEKAPFADPPHGYEAKGAHWVKPVLVAEIQFTEWSAANALRHPVFVGLREDKKPTEVVKEEAVALQPSPSTPANVPARRRQSRPAAKPAARLSATGTVAGVVMSHPDKLLFPEAGLSKLSLARYYEKIAGWILPHVKDRPLSLLRCPDGWNRECFYQKHADRSVHPSVKRVQVPEGDGTATYFSAGSLPALVGLVQWGVVELHPWGSRMPHPEKPDRLIFDFDPAENVSWPQLVEAVQDLRKLLTEFELTGFLKTTGGKGLHVVVPIRPTLTWPQAKTFAKAVADLFARTFPDRFVATATKARRSGKIFIDYLRNAEGATAIAPYAIRARKNAPVSTPLEWTELDKDIRFDFFNVGTVPTRLEKLTADPWQGFAALRQTVTKAMFARLGVKP